VDKSTPGNAAGLAAAVAIAILGAGTTSWAQTTPSQSMWGVTCAGTVAGLDCRALQSLPMTNSGQASVAVRIPPETKKPTMLILVPLSVYLPAGVSLGFGEGEAKTVGFDNCDSAGCLAKYDVTEAELGVMAKGQALTLSVQDTNRRPISIHVPSNGFAAAFAKIK
jgi:invasion protein IalB